MQVFKSLKICFVVLFLGSPMLSFAQYKFEVLPFWNYFKDKRRWEIGGSIITAKGQFEGVTRVVGYNNRFLGDSTLKRSLNAKLGFGGSFGVSTPFAATGHISAFAVSFTVLGNMYQWADLNKNYNIEGNFKAVDSNRLNASTLQIGMPVAIEWKSGTEGLVLTHRLSVGGAIGAGIFPHLNMTVLDGLTTIAAQQSIGANPFFKGELAFRRGIVWKLRAMYTMGNIELINQTKAIPKYNDGPFNLTYNSNLQFSLIVMPFKRRYTESAWYNDYDTYNWNEKLN
jgi:hypothetical protein